MISISSQKENIINVASKIIRHKGIECTSLGDIAKGVGISKGTLYYYYPSKDELIYDIAIHHLNKISDELLTLANTEYKKSNKKELLNLLFHRIIQDETRNRLHLYLLQGAITSNIELMKKFKNEYISWKEMISEGLQKVYTIENDDYNYMSQILLAILDGLIIQHLLGIEIADIDKLTEIMVKTL